MHCCAADIDSLCVIHSTETGSRPAASVAARWPSSASEQWWIPLAPPVQDSISIVMPAMRQKGKEAKRQRVSGEPGGEPEATAER